jgi:hypothetical protein
MKHKYRRVVTVEAEQFDGSDEMATEYGLKRFGWTGFAKNYGKNNFEIGGPLVISKGDWILKGSNGKYFVLSDYEFKQNYERTN